FLRGGAEVRLAETARSRTSALVEAGVEGNKILNSGHPGFERRLKGPFTTPPLVPGPLFRPGVLAPSSSSTGCPDLDREFQRTGQALLETFAVHESASVQHTLCAMGEAALAAVPEITAIRLSLPNKHHLLVDLARFGLENANEIFVATDEPFGLI